MLENHCFFKHMNGIKFCWYKKIHSRLWLASLNLLINLWSWKFNEYSTASMKISWVLSFMRIYYFIPLFFLHHLSVSSHFHSYLISPIFIAYPCFSLVSYKYWVASYKTQGGSDEKLIHVCGAEAWKII